MVNYRNNDRDIRQDCVRIWNVLVQRAHEAEPITYTDLSAQAGVDFGKIRDSTRLGRIGNYCTNNNLPPLDAPGSHGDNRKTWRRFFRSPN